MDISSSVAFPVDEGVGNIDNRSDIESVPLFDSLYQLELESNVSNGQRRIGQDNDSHNGSLYLSVFSANIGSIENPGSGDDARSYEALWSDGDIDLDMDDQSHSNDDFSDADHSGGTDDFNTW